MARAGPGTRTVLFTDLVGSTSLRTELGDRAADDLRRDHDRLLSAAVESHGGVVVKSTGDGVMAVFESAADGAACAVRMQQAIERYRRTCGIGLAIRVGLSAGDVAREQDDYFGTPVVEAARLEAAAEGDQILAADIVRALAGSRTDVVFEPVGALELKGLAAPLTAHSVLWEPADDGEDDVAKLPRAAASRNPAELVGRDAVLAGLLARWESVTRGEAAVVMLVGEPGVGKTALAARLAVEVHSSCRVLWGHADPSADGTPALADALQLWAESVSPESLVALLGDLAPANLRTGGFDQLDEGTLVEVLARLAGERPLLVVLDGVGPAVAADLDLLRRIAREPVAGAMVVATSLGTGAVGPTSTSREPLERMQIGPLSDESAALVLQYGLGDAASAVEAEEPQVFTALLADAHGNPHLLRRAALGVRAQRLATRVSESATQAQLSRVDLQQVRDSLAADVLELQRLREPDSEFLVESPAADPPGTPPAAVPCPYKGLVRFEADDAQYFCGRERLVAKLVARLVSARMVGVVGASGSGKSSLVRAGLLPAVRDDALPGSGQWRVIVMTPGAEPLGELARALSRIARGRPDYELVESLRTSSGALDEVARDVAGEGSRLMLVVDQFEEIFTNCHSETERRQFVDELLHASSRPGGSTLVVGVLRADFYGRCAEHEPLATQLADGQLLVGPMSVDELRRSVEEPARRAGLVLEPDLVDEIIKDVGQEPAALPLLSTALLETWQRRSGRTLTIAAYREAGGVRGAVARLAETVWASLSDPERVAARRVFLRLVAAGQGAEDVRRRAPLSELQTFDDGVTERMLNVLVERRLVVTDQTSAEVAHEALLREWPRLRDWLAEDREGRRVHQSLSEAAGEWESSGREADQLYRGGRLATATEWAAGHSEEVQPAERVFLDASRARMRRAARRGRAAVAALSLLLVASIIAGYFAYQARNDADAAALVADARRLASESQTVQDSNPGRSLLLALEANRLDDSSDTRGALLAAVQQSPRLVALIPGFGSEIGGMDLTPDGRSIVMGGFDGRVRLVDARTRRVTDAWPTDHRGRIWTVSVSPDGEMVATTGNDGTARFFRLRSGARAAPTFRWPEPTPLKEAGFSPDGRRFFAKPPLDLDRVWEVATGRELQWSSAPGPPASLDADKQGATFGPNSVEMIYATDFVEVWNTDTGEHARSLDPRPPPARFVDVSADGRILAVTREGEVTLLDPQTGAMRGPRITVDGGWSSAVSADGRRVATSLENGNIVVHDVTSGAPMGGPLVGHSGIADDLRFAPDGQTLLSASTDEVAIWDLDGEASIGRTLGQVPPVAGIGDPNGGGGYGLAVAPDGRTVLTGENRGLNLWPISTGRPERQELHPALAFGTSGVAIDPTGRRVLTGGLDGKLVLSDRRTGRPLRPPLQLNRPPLDPEVGGVNAGDGTWGTAISRNGQLGAVGLGDGRVVIIDLEAWKVVRRINAHAPGYVVGIAFSPDGRHVASGGQDGLSVSDIKTGKRVHGITRGANFTLGVAYSPDGREIAVGFSDGTAQLLDAETGRRHGPPHVFNRGWVGGVAYSPDGSTIAMAQGDGTVHLIDATTRRTLGTPMTGHTNQVIGVGFFPDGKRLATTSLDGTTRLWDVDPASWARRACKVAGRNLTPDEWEQYLGVRAYHETCSRPARTA